LQGVQVVEAVGHDDRRVARGEPEVRGRVGEGATVAGDGEQGGAVLAPQPRREVLDAEVGVLLGQLDPVELRPVAAGDDVRDEGGQPRVEGRAGEQP
jgi:hypothetical protein